MNSIIPKRVGVEPVKRLPIYINCLSTTTILMSVTTSWQIIANSGYNIATYDLSLQLGKSMAGLHWNVN